jgi:hypothetical protein
MSYNPTSCPAQLRQCRWKRLNITQHRGTECNKGIDHAIGRACQATPRKNARHHAIHRPIPSAEGQKRRSCDLAYRSQNNFLLPKTDN